MGKRVQPGGRVDEELYEQFKQFVKQQHGKVRGSLGDELEIAMKERMNSVNTTDQLTRIENDLAHVKALVADGDTDGGTGGISTPAPVESDGEVRARANSASDPSAADDWPDDPPHYNQPRAEKAAWLARQATERGGSEQAITRPALRHILDGQYGFEDDTVEDITDRAIDLLGAELDPTADPEREIFAWGETLAEREAEFEDDQHDDAADRLDDLDAAERGRR